MLCQCGCGQPAPLAPQTSTKYGWVAGEPVRFIAGHNARLQKRQTGYRMLNMPEHPRATTNGYVLEHIVIVERALGHPIPRPGEVHHVDENPRNNANSNLVVCHDRAYHHLLHLRTKVVKAGGDPNTQRVCGTCKRPRLFAEFNRSLVTKDGITTHCCRECNKAAYRRRKQQRAA